MNYATIKWADGSNGPGVRVSLFVSGCTHRCPELISISATVNKVNAAVNEIKAGLAQQ